MVIRLLGCGHQDERHFVVNVVLTTPVSTCGSSIGEDAHCDLFGDGWEPRVRLRFSRVSFNETHLLLDVSHLCTEVNKLFFLVELSEVVRECNE